MLKIIKQNIDKEIEKIISEKEFKLDRPEEAAVKEIIAQVKSKGSKRRAIFAAGPGIRKNKDDKCSFTFIIP